MNFMILIPLVTLLVLFISFLFIIAGMLGDLFSGPGKRTSSENSMLAQEVYNELNNLQRRMEALENKVTEHENTGREANQ